jgi:hypothetical protein
MDSMSKAIRARQRIDVKERKTVKKRCVLVGRGPLIDENVY